MAAGRKFGADGGGYSGFHVNVATSKGELGKAGCFEGGLQVHFVIHEVGNELRVRLRLVPATHDAKRDSDVAIGHERGDNSMQRTLASGENIGAGGVEAE